MSISTIYNELRLIALNEFQDVVLRAEILEFYRATRTKCDLTSLTDHCSMSFYRSLVDIPIIGSGD